MYICKNVCVYVVVTNLDLRDDGCERCCVGGEREERIIILCSSCIICYTFIIRRRRRRRRLLAERVCARACECPSWWLACNYYYYCTYMPTPPPPFPHRIQLHYNLLLNHNRVYVLYVDHVISVCIGKREFRYNFKDYAKCQKYKRVFYCRRAVVNAPHNYIHSSIAYGVQVGTRIV